MVIRRWAGVWLSLSLALLLGCHEPAQSVFNEANILEARWNDYWEELHATETCLLSAQEICPSNKEILKVRAFMTPDDEISLVDTLASDYHARCVLLDKLRERTAGVSEKYLTMRKEYNEFHRKLMDRSFEKSFARKRLQHYYQRLHKSQEQLKELQSNIKNALLRHNRTVSRIKGTFQAFDGDKIDCKIR